MIKTDVEFGVVHCSGDGVDETIRFPNDLYCKEIVLKFINRI